MKNQIINKWIAEYLKEMAISSLETSEVCEVKCDTNKHVTTLVMYHWINGGYDRDYGCDYEIRISELDVVSLILKDGIEISIKSYGDLPVESLHKTFEYSELVKK